MAIEVRLQTKRLLLQTITTDAKIYEVFDYVRRNREFFEPWEPEYEKDEFTFRFQRNRIREDKILMRQGKAVRFWLFHKGQDEILGDIRFSSIIRGAFQSCFLGYKIDQDEINQGYATEGLRRCIQFMFDNLKLHRVEANVMPHNKPSIRVLEKLNFEKTGFSRKYLKINGNWEDHIHYEIINEKMENTEVEAPAPFYPYSD